MCSRERERGIETQILFGKEKKVQKNYLTKKEAGTRALAREMLIQTSCLEREKDETK